MTYAEYDAYIQSIDGMEQRVINDNVYPKVRSNRCKAFCYVISELTKECIRYFKISTNNNCHQKQSQRVKQKSVRNPSLKILSLVVMKKTKVVKIDEDKRMRSKDICFNCPHCSGKLILQNSIEINPKGVKCRCNGCSFKLSRNDKSVNVSRDDNGEIKVDAERPFDKLLF